MNIKVAAITEITADRSQVELELDVTKDQVDDIIGVIGEYYGDRFIIHNMLNQLGEKQFLDLVSEVVKERT